MHAFRTALIRSITSLTGHSSNAVRQSNAAAIAEGVGHHPDHVADALMQLIAEYQEKAKELLPQYDKFGMLIEESLDIEDPWRTRKALATTLRLLSPFFSPVDVKTFFDLLITGEGLGDRSQSVRSEMLEVSRTCTLLDCGISLMKTSICRLQWLLSIFTERRTFKTSLYSSKITSANPVLELRFTITSRRL